MRITLWVSVILVCAALSSAGAGPKLAGNGVDTAALSKVKTYCVDTSNLKRTAGPGDFTDARAMDVQELLKTESGPAGLLAQLPWRMEANCSVPGADAVLRSDFSATGGGFVPLPAGERNPAEGPPPRSLSWVAKLQVSDKASGRVIYKVQGNSLD